MLAVFQVCCLLKREGIMLELSVSWNETQRKGPGSDPHSGECAVQVSLWVKFLTPAKGFSTWDAKVAKKDSRIFPSCSLISNLVVNCLFKINMFYFAKHNESLLVWWDGVYSLSRSSYYKWAEYLGFFIRIYAAGRLELGMDACWAPWGCEAGVAEPGCRAELCGCLSCGKLAVETKPETLQWESQNNLL